MSESTPAPSAPDMPPPAAETTVAKKQKKRRTWKQRMRLALVVIIVVALLVRLGLYYLLPTVVRKVANAYDLDCEWDRMSLSLMSGNAHIWGLVLRPKSGGESIVHADYIQGSLSTRDLFRGKLVVYRAEVDGVDMLIDREPDGSIPILTRFLTPPEDAPIEVRPEEQASAEGAATQPVSLKSPFRIDAIRVSHVKTRFRDRSVTPVFETTVRTTLRVSDVGSDNLPAQFELQVDADPLLDALVISGQLQSSPTSIDAQMQFALRGLHPRPAAVYLLPLGLKPVADGIDIHATATLSASVAEGSSDVTGRLAVHDISATADSEEWAALKSLTLDATRLSSEAIELGTLLIESGRASAGRSVDGGVRIAGFELVPPAPAASIPAPPAPPAPGKPADDAESGLPLRIALQKLHLSDLQADFDDRAVVPPARLTGRLDEMTVSNLVYDPADRESATTFSGSASLPGVIEAVTWSGSAVPLGNIKRADATLKAVGIAPEALKPYLAQMGVESTLSAGTFTAFVQAGEQIGPDGKRSITAQLGDVRLADGEALLLAMHSAHVGGLAIGEGLIRANGIDLSGPTLHVTRDSTGAIAALGLRLKPSAAPAAPPAAAPPLASPATTAAMPATQPREDAVALPRIEIDRFNWADVQLTLEDQYAADKPAVLRGQAGVEASQIVFDPSGKTATPPGRFSAWLTMPDVAERVAVDGILKASPDGATLNSNISAQGLTGAALQHYLAPLGIELTLKDGRIAAQTLVSVSMADQKLTAGFELNQASYTDGEEELAGVDALRIEGVRASSSRVSIEQIEITKPRGSIARNSDGSLAAAGVRLVAAPPSTHPTPPLAGPPAGPAALKLAGLPIDVSVGQIRLNSGALRLADRAVTPALETVLQGGVQLDGLSSMPTSAPARIDIRGGLAGIIEQAAASGTLRLAPNAPAAKLAISAEQISAARLAPYLPPGITSTLREGRFAADIDAAIANHAQGGLVGHLLLDKLSLEERATNATLGRVGSFAVRINRFDPAGGVIAIDEITSAGVALDVSGGPEGSIDVVGFRVGAAPDEASPAAPPPAPVAAAAPAEAPPATVATTQPAVDVAALVADARRPLPLVTVGKLDLHLERLRVQNLPGLGGAPVDLSDFRLRNTGPVEVAGQNADQRPPLKLQIDGAVAPLADSVKIALESALFAAEPTLAIDVAVDGISGPGLLAVAPQLAEQIEGQNLTQGTFVTRLDASINYGRRGPRDMDLSRGFTAGFMLKPAEFRGEPGGPILLGLEEARGEGIRVEPRTGNVIIKSIELVKPIGRFHRDEEGLHALGLVIPLEETASATQPAEAVAEAVPEAAKPAAPAGPPQRPASEIRLDRFAVSGVDVVIEDRTSTPPTIIPLKTLDVEVRDVSNQMLWTGKPIRFDLLCTSDKVPLPPRKGATGAAPAEADGREMRELFSQVTASGRIGLKLGEQGQTTLTGWAKTSVQGFELLGVAGLAKPFDIDVGGGVFDDSTDIRFKEDGSIETRNRIVFTNLSLTEPANGPIQRTLKLPAPIDAAIGALTDPDGSITMNLPVTIEQGTIEPGKLVAPAIAAVANVLITATVSAPVKTLEGVGGLLGLGGKSDRAPEPPVELAFLPGIASLSPAESAELAALAQRMRKQKDLQLQLRHELTADDIAHTSRRANPSAADVRTMTERLRRDRSRLLTERTAQAARTRAQYASQSAGADEAMQRLRQIDQQVARIDASLDQLYELLRPGAGTQADRRTRSASLQVARERFDVLQAALTEAGVPDVANRVRRTNPQFDITEAAGGGRVIITLVPKKQ